MGKTSLAKALANSIDCTWKRVQFTPDLLPSDVVGVTVWNRGTDRFEFRPGPVFANIVLGDEINRASPKTQSSLLEAMEERQVTVDGTSYRLEPPFMVIATQNPADHEGTYPLPENQLDRFLMRISIGYPDRQSEIEILDVHAGLTTLPNVRAVATASQVESMVQAVRTVHVAPAVKGYLVDLADASRRHPGVHLGMSPRATLSLLRAVPRPCCGIGPQLRHPRRREGPRRNGAGSPVRALARRAAPRGRRPRRGAGRARLGAGPDDEVARAHPPGLGAPRGGGHHLLGRPAVRPRRAVHRRRRRS